MVLKTNYDKNKNEQQFKKGHTINIVTPQQPKNDQWMTFNPRRTKAFFLHRKGSKLPFL